MPLKTRARKRVLIIVHSYFLRDTRPRRHATALADAGWDVDVVCARDVGEPRTETAGSVRIHRLPARRRRGSKWRYIFEYLSFVLLALTYSSLLTLRRKYRAVYVVGIPNFLVFAAAVGKVLGARVLLDMRDPLPEFFMGKYGLDEGSAFARGLLMEERISCAFADVVVAPHEWCARLYERSAPPSKIISVMNAPDPRLFAGDPERTNDPNDRTILYAGTVAYRYGVDLVVQAVARLKQHIPALQLRIVGDGDLVPTLRRIARELDVAERVMFEGPLPLDRIPEIARSAWLGVQANRDDALMRYLFPQKVLEWLSIGLPVVVGETPPLLEAFGRDVLFFHLPGDLEDLCRCILEANDDAEGVRERVVRGKKEAARFDYGRQIKRLLTAVDA